ncbi:MAG: hypothetical protein JXR76_29540 [Deltaproteobacteria bacterium]|nr:hypothetical protein [Deltaproteobacteria bacterium]
MKYLYGNGSLSNLDQNYLEFLRLSLDFSVEVLQSETRISGLQEAVSEADAVAEVERRQVAELGEQVATLLDNATDGDSKVSTVSLRDSLKKVCAGEVSRARKSIDSNLQNLIAQTNNEVVSERAANVPRLFKILQTCDLPNTTKQYAIVLDVSGTYSGRLKAASDKLIQMDMTLAPPPGNLFNEAIRVDTILPDLQIDLPETGGWLKRGSRITPQRLSKEYVTAVSVNGNGVLVSLRNAPREGQAGYDILYQPESIKVSRISKQQEASEPYAVEKRDLEQLRQLYIPIFNAAEDMSWSRCALTRVLIDKKPLDTLPEPKQLVLWLLTHLTPVVQAIAQNTLSPTELVLKRVLGDDKREEVFVSKAELLEKLAPLTDEHKTVFAPLGLERDNRNMRGLPEPEKSSFFATQPKERAATLPVMTAFNVSEPQGHDSGSAESPARNSKEMEKQTRENVSRLVTQPAPPPPKTGNRTEPSLILESERSLMLEIPDEPTSELDLSTLPEEDSIMLETSPKAAASSGRTKPPMPQGRGSLPPKRDSLTTKLGSIPPSRGTAPPSRLSGLPSAKPPPPPSRTSLSASPPAKPPTLPGGATPSRPPLPPQNRVSMAPIASDRDSEIAVDDTLKAKSVLKKNKPHKATGTKKK